MNIKLLACLAIFFISFTKTTAQNDSILYGITRDSITQDLYLSKINTATGNVTIISATGFSNGYSMSAMGTIDPYNHIFYLQSASNLIGIDVSNGNIVTNTPITTPFPAYFDFMQFACNDSVLYGITRNSTTQELYLSKMNIQTGNVILISSVPFSASCALGGLSTIDPFENIFYLQSNNKLLGVDLDLGTVVTDSTITTPFPGYFDLMQFNCKDSVLYGILRNSSTQELYLSKANTTTAQISTISTLPPSSSYILNALATIDPYLNIYYLQSNSQLYGINLNTGNVDLNITITTPFPAYFDLMKFYSTSCRKSFVGITEKSSNSVSFNIYPNPFNQQTTIEFKNIGSEKHVLRIYNSLGQKVLDSDNIQSGKIIIERESLKNGIYYFQLSKNEKLISSGKMLID